MNRKFIKIPLALICDDNLSATAKVIYALLQSQAVGKPDSSVSPSIVISHREFIELSNLSQKTIVKALNNLEASGWIDRHRNSGSSNRYVVRSSNRADASESGR